MEYFLKHSATQVSALAELRRYCYFAAGIVGEMLTDIFATRIAGLAVSPSARSEARAFGEGLQLVNILKDDTADARRGRSFIPDGVDRGTLYRLVRQDLLVAQDYVERLQRARAPSGYISFTRLPLQLAWATLDRIEQRGSGAKVSRTQLSRILLDLQSPPGRASFRGTRECLQSSLGVAVP